jgi:hypothetical protein
VVPDCAAGEAGPVAARSVWAGSALSTEDRLPPVEGAIQKV